MQPESFFLEDDGSIPNSRLPLLIYRDVFTDHDRGEQIGLKTSLSKTTGITHGEMGCSAIIITTAIRTKC
jgi:uncharacterized protein YjlB